MDVDGATLLRAVGRGCGRRQSHDRMAAASRAGGGLRQAWRCGTEGRPSVASHDRDRAVALSLQLAQAHQELRRQIDQLKADLGQHRPDNDRLVTHCLAFCAALTVHHQGEDTGMFAELLRERPDLAGTVAKLVQDHETIASILSRVAELATHGARSDGPGLEAVGRELDGLAAIMASHFNYEERAISVALDDGIPDTGWSARVFRFRGDVR
jgi:Hemerythrin HHE cation binding domain